jgi:hypothetical protein
VNIANLIRIHEAGIAHHVTAVGQVDSQNCAATKLDVGRAMMVDVGILGSFKVTTKEERFDALEKRRVSCHHVNKLTVLRASLAHDYLSVFFHNLGFDFARMFIHQ